MESPYNKKLAELAHNIVDKLSTTPEFHQATVNVTQFANIQTSPDSLLARNMTELSKKLTANLPQPEQSVFDALTNIKVTMPTMKDLLGEDFLKELQGKEPPTKMDGIHPGFLQAIGYLVVSSSTVETLFHHMGVILTANKDDKAKKAAWGKSGQGMKTALTQALKSFTEDDQFRNDVAKCLKVNSDKLIEFRNLIIHGHFPFTPRNPDYPAPLGIDLGANRQFVYKANPVFGKKKNPEQLMTTETTMVTMELILNHTETLEKLAVLQRDALDGFYERHPERLSDTAV